MRNKERSVCDKEVHMKWWIFAGGDGGMTKENNFTKQRGTVDSSKLSSFSLINVFLCLKDETIQYVFNYSLHRKVHAYSSFYKVLLLGFLFRFVFFFFFFSLYRYFYFQCSLFQYFPFLLIFLYIQLVELNLIEFLYM